MLNASAQNCRPPTYHSGSNCDFPWGAFGVLASYQGDDARARDGVGTAPLLGRRRHSLGYRAMHAAAVIAFASRLTTRFFRRSS
jgi:hypothetical protein